MIKKIFWAGTFILFLLFVFSSTYLLSYSQSITLSQSKVVYNLPYPGILPDHPLYFLKIFRDKLLEFSTRDYLKKAELYLLYADKRAAMAINLAKKGKDKLAVTTLSKGEKYFQKAVPLLITSKKQGVSASNELVNKFKLSIAKHREIAETLLKELPQGQTAGINEILKLNQTIKNQLESI